MLRPAALICFLLGCALLLAFATPEHASSPLAPTPPTAKIHGIIISTHGAGFDWGNDEIVPTMQAIRAVGANWVSIHPYARIGGDGSVRFRPFDPAQPPAYLARPIREAHQLGLKIAIMPHLAYWGSPFSWKGDIAFTTPEAWARFWQDYNRWIIALATACKDADVFVVGTELDKTLDHQAQWRALIAQVRSATPAQLTFASNWSDYTRVPFWDALDFVGVQAYFPLTEHTHPTEEQIAQGWAARLTELKAYAQKVERPILFTELGYNQSHLAPVEPWNERVDADAGPVQEACWRAALDAVERSPFIAGALLWKWFPHPHPVEEDFQLAIPRIEKIISSFWRPDP